MDKKQMLIRTGNAVLAAILGFSPVTGALTPLVVQAEMVLEDARTLGNIGSDNIVDLAELGSAKYFTFSADVTFNDYEEGQRSAALVFAGMKANVHGKIDWNNPVRIWSDEGVAAESVCSGNKGQDNTWLADNGVSLADTFNLKVTVDTDGSVSYYINDNYACGTQVNEGYQGGTFGLMTFASDATFSNITLDVIEEEVSVDRSSLENLIAECGKLNEADYTKESWTALQEAISHANAAETQEEVDAAVESVLAAKNALEEKPVEKDPEEAKKELEALIEKAESLKEEDYTEESWKTLSEALETARKAESEEEVASAIKTLEAAIRELKKAEKPAEPVAAEDFKNIGAAGASVADGSLILDASGDHFAMLDSQKTPANDFRLEADVQLLEGQGQDPEMSAALVFGASSKKTPGVKWYAANLDTRRKNNADFFRVFGAGSEILGGGVVSDVDVTKPLHLAIDVRADGSFVYTFGNADGNMHEAAGRINDWQGGYVGLLTFCSKAAFSNVKFSDRTVPAEDRKLEETGKWKTNLKDSVLQGGAWTGTEEGLVSDALGQGDAFLISAMKGTDFVYETDVTFDGKEGAAGLIFRYSEGEYGKEGYAVNIDASSHRAKFWRWQEGQALQLLGVPGETIEVPEADTYHLKVTAIGGVIEYWVNDTLVANLGDHTMQANDHDKGQSTIVTEGSYGLINWNARVTFQNTKFTSLDEENTPAVSDVTAGSHTGTVLEKGQFFPESPTWIQYVKHDASSVYLNAEKAGNTEVTFSKDGKDYREGEDIPVEVGVNWITMTVKNDITERIYRLDIHRFDDDSVYYNEPYRGQYHYSVKEGWLNDPCGLVYYKGKYHMFYQFYDQNRWGPMHWMHAVSTDRIHWEEQPVALYPDMNGTMFSGCMAVDETNASKLFDEGGLIAYITSNGNGQRIKMAISEDEGKTWKKIDKIAADWKDDPLGSKDFRDPKVFQWEGKWFMVVAGGPLRIYSSDDMVNWKPEAVYGDLHTECPDLYPQQVNGQIKWILSRGGRYYKVGDLKQVDGTWTFVPDDYYANKDGVMNFGADSYAAMSYYVQSFGTEENPTIPDIVTQNWMNTWDDYCREVGDKVGQAFNGTYNLQLKIGLSQDADGIYRLTQTPIEQYDGLRGEEIKAASGTLVGSDNTLLKDFAGTSYEIVSRFMPAEGTTKVGFKVRTGADGQETLITYDLTNNKLTLDRSKSGIQISGKFTETNSQDLSDLQKVTSVSRNADGSIDLHIYVDSSSVEVFANSCTAAGAIQIFPLPTSQGASIIVEGEPCQADISIYPISTIWTDKAEARKSIQTPDAAKQTLYTGDEKQLSAYILPADSDQTMIWTSSDEAVASVSAKGTVSAQKAGTALITATSKADPDLKVEFEFTVKENNFNTSVRNWIGTSGWEIEDDELIVKDACQNNFRLSEQEYEGDWTVTTDVKYERELINLFLASKESPFADQAYALQLTMGNELRLFRFGGATDASVQLANPLNDGQYHNISIAKEGNKITVSVDGTEVLSHEYTDPDDHFFTGHVGVGVWNGEARFKNFIVTGGGKPEAPKAEIDFDHEDTKTALKDIEIVLDASHVHEDFLAHESIPTEVTVRMTDGSSKTYPVSWDTSRVEFGKAGTYTAYGTLDRNQPALMLLAETDEPESDIRARVSIQEAQAPVTPEKADKTTLTAAIEKAEALSEADYTADSWKALSEAVAKARDVQADDNAVQADVDAAAKAVDDAVDALKQAEKPAKPGTEQPGTEKPEEPGQKDPEEPAADDLKALIKALQEAIAKAEKLTEGSYTADTWKALSDALEKAKALVREGETPDAKQVEAARTALEEAVKALKEKTPAAKPAQSGTTNTQKPSSGSSKAPTAVKTGTFGLMTAAGASLAALLGIRKRRKNR